MHRRLFFLVGHRLIIRQSADADHRMRVHALKSFNLLLTTLVCIYIYQIKMHLAFVDQRKMSLVMMIMIMETIQYTPSNT